MTHKCHCIGCTTIVLPEMFMCKMHWFKLPPDMRRAIWREYRPGQCDDMNPAKSYCEVAKACVFYIAHKEQRTVTGKEPELRLYDYFIEHGKTPN